MAKKEIVNLPALLVFSDDIQIPVYVPGSSESAQKILGLQLREYAEKAAANVKKGDKGDPGDVSSVNGVEPDAKGNVALTPADIDALALSGGTLTGNLVIEKSSVPLLRVKATNLGRYCETRVDSGGNVLITNRADDSNFRGLVINQESGSLINAVQLGQKINDAWSGYNILHTGNKPSGSYTGNGSEATRTIALGGIASGAVLIKNGTNGRDAIVMNAGAIVSRSGTLIGHAYSAVRFKDNALILNTADTDFNANGVTYNYWVL